MDDIYDIIIIGGGPAGLAAAIYSARMGMKTLLLESQWFGGRASTAPDIWNYPGFPDGITGSELIDLMVKQAERFETKMKYATEVLDLSFEEQVKKVVTREETYHGKAVIVSTGTQSKKLQLPGETDFIGRGVSYCTMCDGPLFKGLRVAVIGSGNEAFEDALYLAGQAHTVFLITHLDDITADQTIFDEAKEKTNLEIKEAKLESINGDEVVTSITYSLIDTGKQLELAVNGVFVAIGGIPMTALVSKAGVRVDERGCIKVTRQQLTNLEGVFAAGDCTCGGMQVITAAGEGAMAGINAYRYVKKQNSK